MQNICYILGSGASLLELTPKQRNVIQKSGKIIAMNKYLLFYKKIGIIPNYLLLIDSHFPAHKVVYESIDINQRDLLDVTFCLAKSYRPLFSSGGIHSLRRKLHSKRLYKDHGYVTPEIFPEKILYIRFTHWRKADPNIFKWGKSLNEELYYYRGSLSTTLNFANIVYPKHDIVLLGVDLNSNRYFCDEELKKREDLMDQYYLDGEKNEKHPTTMEYGGLPGLHTLLPQIFTYLKEQGATVYSGSSNSMLIQNNICPLHTKREKNDI